jgi:hypothetical protein
MAQGLEENKRFNFKRAQRKANTNTQGTGLLFFMGERKEASL